MAANVDYNEVLVYMGDERERVPRDVVRARVHPSVTRISGEAFVDCIKLVEVELCEGLLLEIGMGAFRGCNALKTINIPSTVRVINDVHFTAVNNWRR